MTELETGAVKQDTAEFTDGYDTVHDDYYTAEEYSDDEDLQDDPESRMVGGGGYGNTNPNLAAWNRRFQRYQSWRNQGLNTGAGAGANLAVPAFAGGGVAGGIRRGGPVLGVAEVDRTAALQDSQKGASYSKLTATPDDYSYYDDYSSDEAKVASNKISQGGGAWNLYGGNPGFTAGMYGGGMAGGRRSNQNQIFNQNQLYQNGLQSQGYNGFGVQTGGQNSYGGIMDRQALLANRDGWNQGYNGYNSQLTLLRPPPQRSSSLLSLIDIDYETLILLLSVAGVGAGWALYQLILTKGRRRNFKSGSAADAGGGQSQLDMLYDMFYHGLEDFEEKLDRMEEKETQKGDEGENGGWLSNIAKEFLRVKQETEMEIKQEEEEDAADDGVGLEDLEPPILDPNWDRDQETLQNTDEKRGGRLRRAVRYEDDAPSENSNETCKIKFWRCLSGVMESGVKYIDKPEGLTGFMKKALFKIAFHGGFSGSWGSLMSIPEARQTAHCFRENDECVTKEIISNDIPDSEAGNSRRFIVDPEYLQGLDTSDGATQWNEEDMPEDY